MVGIENKIELWLNEELEERELFLVDIKLSANKIMVFIDKEPRVTIQECAKISRYLEPYLDEEPGVPENYNLEVSSPGMSNPLKVHRQYVKQVGKKLNITKTDGDKFLAEVLEANETNIKVKKVVKPKKKKEPVVEQEPFTLEYTDIKKAIIHFKF